jgi:hypothetical protein
MSKFRKYVGDFEGGMIFLVIGWLVSISLLLTAYGFGRRLAAHYFGEVIPTCWLVLCSGTRLRLPSIA